MDLISFHSGRKRKVSKNDNVGSIVFGPGSKADERFPYSLDDLKREFAPESKYSKEIKCFARCQNERHGYCTKVWLFTIDHNGKCTGYKHIEEVLHDINNKV